MDNPGLTLGMFVACVHWWLFEKFVKSLTGQQSRKRLMVLASLRWWLTAALGMLSVRLSGVSVWDFVLGFIVASFTVRVALAIRYRAKQP